MGSYSYDRDVYSSSSYSNWGASSYSIYDIVTLVDADRITIHKGSLSEYTPTLETKGKKK